MHPAKRDPPATLLLTQPDAVEARFYLVRNDVSRFLSALQETETLSATPQTQHMMVDMLERMATWQRAWGLPLRSFGE